MTGQRWQYKKPAPTPGRVCKDCTDETYPTVARKHRPAPHPGPRCATHHNAKKRSDRLAAKQRHVTRTYELSPEEYNALYEFQGGQCALRCGAKGTGRKRLAVDHDHHQALLDGHDPAKGCRNCIRGLVCSTCNDVLAHARSMPSFFDLGAVYLRQPPWKSLLSAESTQRVGLSP